MATCVPIRDMRDTARFVEVVDGANAPVTVTKNGYDTLVVMTPQVYNGIQMELSRARLLEHIREAESDIAAGNLIDFDEFIDALRQRDGR